MTFQFNNTNLEFNDLLTAYKKITNNDSLNNNFKISSFIGCNLYDSTSTTSLTSSTLPENNLIIENFKNKIYIYDRDVILNIDDQFILNRDNANCYSRIDSSKYVDGFRLSAAINNFFTISTKNIYTSSIIINIDTATYDFVSSSETDGALRIDLNNINNHFNNFLTKVTVNIKDYVTGKHGTNGSVGLASPYNGGKGSDGTNGSFAVNIMNVGINPNLLLIINDYDKVHGGFGASGGKGGDGYQKLVIQTYKWDSGSTSSTINDEKHYIKLKAIYNEWVWNDVVLDGEVSRTTTTIGSPPTSTPIANGQTHHVYHSNASISKYRNYFTYYGIYRTTYTSIVDNPGKAAIAATNGTRPSQTPGFSNNKGNPLQPQDGTPGNNAYNGAVGAKGNPGTNGKKYRIDIPGQSTQLEDFISGHTSANLIINNVT